MTRLRSCARRRLAFVVVVAGCGDDAASSAGGASAGGGPPILPCSDEPSGPPDVYEPVDRPNDVVWIETPRIIHEQDFYSYEDFVQPDAPVDWTSPVDFTQGQLWIHVEVFETPPDAIFPIYYTVTWGPARDGVIDGFLRAAVEIDEPGPAVYDEVADLKSIEWSPDGSCCQGVCGQPWPWDAAWTDVAGDVVVLEGNGFPLEVQARLVLRPPQ